MGSPQDLLTGNFHTHGQGTHARTPQRNSSNRHKKCLLLPKSVYKQYKKNCYNKLVRASRNSIHTSISQTWHLKKNHTRRIVWRIFARSSCKDRAPGPWQPVVSSLQSKYLWATPTGNLTSTRKFAEKMAVQDLDPRFVRTRAVEMHLDMWRAMLRANSEVKWRKPRPRPTLRASLRRRMHMDIWHKQFHENRREKNGKLIHQPLTILSVDTLSGKKNSSAIFRVNWFLLNPFFVEPFLFWTTGKMFPRTAWCWASRKVPCRFWRMQDRMIILLSSIARVLNVLTMEFIVRNSHHMVSHQGTQQFICHCVSIALLLLKRKRSGIPLKQRYAQTKKTTIVPFSGWCKGHMKSLDMFSSAPAST